MCAYLGAATRLSKITSISSTGHGPSGRKRCSSSSRTKKHKITISNSCSGASPLDGQTHGHRYRRFPRKKYDKSHSSCCPAEQPEPYICVLSMLACPYKLTRLTAEHRIFCWCLVPLELEAARDWLKIISRGVFCAIAARRARAHPVIVEKREFKKV